MALTKKVQNGLAGIVCLALVCLLGSIMASTARADPQEGWVSFDGYTTTPTQPEIRVLESSSELVRLEVDIFGMNVENVDVEGENYQKLKIPEYTWSEEIGSPRVPVIRELVAIPECAQVGYTVVPTDSIVLEGYNLYPVPQLVAHQDEHGTGWMEEVFTKDDSVYKSSNLYPMECGELITTAYIREQRIAHIAINPIRFNPVTGELVVYPHFEVELSFSSSKGMLTVNTGIFGNICGNTILNYPSTGMGASNNIPFGKGKGNYTRITNPSGNITADYLIITGDSLFYSSWVDSLAAKRADYDGFDVVIAKVEDIYVNYPPPPEEPYYVSIHDFIQDVYGNGTAHHTFDGKLGYVLLVGDAFYDNNVTEMVPASYEYGIGEDLEAASDHYYTCVTEVTPGSGNYDNFPDLMIGRLSVGNETELSNVVRKILNYEPLPAGAAWRKGIVLSSGSYPGDLNGDIWQEAEAVFRYVAEEVIPEDYLISYIYRHEETEVEADSFYHAYPRPESRYYNFKLFNRGELIYIYRGHGGWFDTGSDAGSCLHGGDVDSMTNAQSLPLVLNFTCKTGWFDNVTEQDGDNGSYDCMAEQFVNAESVGAIGFLASSRNSYGSNNDAFTKKSTEAIFDDHCYMIGEATMASKIVLLRVGWQLTGVRQYNLFGDPALNIMYDEETSTKPDMALNDKDIFFSPSFPSRGDLITFKANVRNRWKIDASDVSVSFWLGHPDSLSSVFLGQQTISSLPAWQADTVQAVYNSAEGELGQHDVYVIVDPQDEIEEAAEENNQGRTSFYLYLYQSNFPIAVSGAYQSSPTLTDIGGGNSSPEILIGRHCLEGDGSQLWSYTTKITSSPAVGDLDGDGSLEVVGVGDNTVYVFNGLDGWERFSYTYPAGTTGESYISSTSLANVNPGADDDLEIIFSVKVEKGIWPSEPEYRVCALKGDGSFLWDNDFADADLSLPAIGDADNDGCLEVVVGSADGQLYLLNGSDGEIDHQWPIGSPILSSNLAPVLADLDDDDTLEVVIAGSDFCLYAFDGSSGTIEWSRPLNSRPIPAIAVGDMHGDGSPDVIVTSNKKIYIISGMDGTLSMTIDPGMGLEGSTVIKSSPIIADINGDGQQEIIVGIQHLPPIDGQIDWIYAIEADGTNLVELPILSRAASTSAVGDLDGDGDAEIVVGGQDERVHTLDYWGNLGKIEWGKLYGGIRNDNLYGRLYVCGHITGNTTWSGRVVVLGDVTVDSGVVLTVQAGTDVEFRANQDNKKSGVDTSLCELMVYGTLHVPGTSSQPVTFTSTSSNKGDWHGIRVLNGGCAEIQYANIEYGYGGVSFDSASGGNVVSCTIRDNLIYGIRGCATANLYICGNTIAMPVLECDEPRGGGSTPTTGIYIEDASAQIVDNVIGGGYYGIYGVGLDSTAVIKGSSPLEQILERNVVGLALYSGSRPRVSGNKISEYRDIGVACYESCPLLGDSLIPGTGYNEITPYTCSPQYAVYCEGVTDTIKAEMNWWGESPPDPSWFYGPVDYAPWLTGPPDVGVEPTTRQHLPDHFSLSQNYPNPFNPITEIGYALPKDCWVRLEVYNILGQRVVTLTDGIQEAGYKAIHWDASGMASGVYIYRIRAGDFIFTRKMLLLR